MAKQKSECSTSSPGCPKTYPYKAPELGCVDPATTRPEVCRPDISCRAGMAWSESKGKCDFSPPPGGYLCANTGGLFECGGWGRPGDPCYQDRPDIQNGVCVIVPGGFFQFAPVPYEACPGLTLSITVTALIAVICR